MTLLTAADAEAVADKLARDELFWLDLHLPTERDFALLRDVFEVVPLALDFCFTRLAHDDEAAWIRERFRAACVALGTEVREERRRLVVELS